MFRASLFFLLAISTSPLAQARVNGLIVGGEEAQKGELPFIVSLQDSYGHFCGGSLIRPDWVLTAAHCVTGGGPSQVLVGLHDRTRPQDAEIFRPARIFRHPKYNSSNMDFDYALIQLDHASTIEPIDLNAAELPVSTNLVTAGWGVTNERGDDLPEVLRKVSVPLVEQNLCRTAYGREEVTERMICAGFDGGGKDSCQGDSGGPLLAQADGKKILVGIVSWGEGCARPRKYGVYSRVSAGLSWIQSTIQ